MSCTAALIATLTRNPTTVTNVMHLWCSHMVSRKRDNKCKNYNLTKCG